MRTVTFLWHWGIALGLATACGPQDRLKSDLTDDTHWPTLASSPGTGLKTFTWAKQQNATATGSVLTDIVSHLPASFGNTYYDADKITWGHETSHGISAHLRDAKNDTGRKANAFYVLNDKAAIVIEPSMSKTGVAAYVPASLRGDRFSTYVAGQSAWNDTPLYLLDEMNAYVNGGAVGVDLVKNGLWVGEARDAVAGQIEFTAYALALGMAVRQHDPEYFASYPQFSEFLAFTIERSMRIFRVGAEMAPFKRDEQLEYFERLRTSADAAPLRWFASRLFGAAWTQDVLLAPLAATELTEPARGSQPARPRRPAEPTPAEPTPAEPAEPSEPDEPSEPTPPEPTPVEPTPTDPSEIDSDGDGIMDDQDLCSNTPAGARVWTYGAWIGCSGGQQRD